MASCCVPKRSSPALAILLNEFIIALGRYSLLLVQHPHSLPTALLVKSFVRRLVRVQRLQRRFRALLIWIFPELVLIGSIGHMSSRIFKISKS